MVDILLGILFLAVGFTLVFYQILKKQKETSTFGKLVVIRSLGLGIALILLGFYYLADGVL